MAEENENLDSLNEDNDIVIGDEDDVDAIREKFAKLEETHKKVLETNKQIFARAKKAEGFELKDGKWVKPPVEPKPEPKPSPTGELDETQLDYLDLKGITEDEDIEIIKNVVKKTGQTVRQALMDEYIISKLDSNKQARDVKNATPSATRRGGNQTTDIAQALAKFEQTGELPDDFTLRSQVVNAKADKENSNKPAWHK